MTINICKHAKLLQTKLLNLMFRLVDITFGHFPEVLHHNHRFIPERGMMKITLFLEKEPQRIESEAWEKLWQIFPHLRDHQCRGNLCTTQFGQLNQVNSSLPIILTGDSIDLVHLLEHLIIDLQCTIQGMNVCSGITCNYKQPPNKYDIFVECLDRRVGFLTVILAIDILQSILHCTPCLSQCALLIQRAADFCHG